MGFSRLKYPGNGDSPIEFSPTGLDRYKVIDRRTARVLGMVEKVQLRGKKTPRWAVVLPSGVPSTVTHSSRTSATGALYRMTTGKTLSLPVGASRT